MTAERTLLPLGGVVEFMAPWLPPAEADALLDEVRATTPWSQGTIVLFGRERREPRLTAWFGDADYRYSGRWMRAAPWPHALGGLRARVEAAAGGPLNAVLLNWYRDGQDSMGLHADDEPELGPDPTIASVSLGASRRFVLVPKKKSAQKVGAFTWTLDHGSLLVMSGSCQHHYRHGVPKDPRCAADRINLTFRRIHPG